jgi:hypothetical protein
VQWVLVEDSSSQKNGPFRASEQRSLEATREELGHDAPTPLVMPPHQGSSESTWSLPYCQTLSRNFSGKKIYNRHFDLSAVGIGNPENFQCLIIISQLDCPKIVLNGLQMPTDYFGFVRPREEHLSNADRRDTTV